MAPEPAFDPVAFEAGPGHAPVSGAPHLTRSPGALLREITVLDEYGQRRAIHLPSERPLTVFVDRRELITLMTLGAQPELLVLGYLLNQRLVDRLSDLESVTVDWEVEAAAVKTRHGVDDLDSRTARRVVTTGCGQGTVYGDLMGQLDAMRLPAASEARIRQSTLLALLEQVRLRNSVHKKAGSVHGCALFLGARLLVAVEDVGRHNAVDTIAGWMALHGVAGADKIFYTTGRLTSEMVIKAAQMGVPIVVSRNGATAMGHEVASRLGMTLFGRATHRHFLCYCGFERFDAEPSAQPPPVRLVGRGA
jgi:FdhD protein